MDFFVRVFTLVSLFLGLGFAVFFRKRYPHIPSSNFWVGYILLNAALGGIAIAFVKIFYAQRLDLSVVYIPSCFMFIGELLGMGMCISERPQQRFLRQVDEEYDEFINSVHY